MVISSDAYIKNWNTLERNSTERVLSMSYNYSNNNEIKKNLFKTKVNTRNTYTRATVH